MPSPPTQSTCWLVSGVTKLLSGTAVNPSCSNSTNRGVAFSLKRFPAGQPWSLQDAAGPVVQQDFIAVPPFFRTWWFTLVAITVLALPPGVWYRNRVERRLALERLRLRIATDLHDDLGSGLTQVSLYSELIRRASEPQVAAWAEQVGDQARSLSEGMRDIIWAIHPQHETWESVESRIKDYAVSLLAPRGIVLDMQGTLTGAPPMTWCRN